MVPRLHQRGSDFRRACWYVLHDTAKTTDERVLWSDTANLGGIAPDDAWRPMYETWRDRTRLKREAGVDLRGRDNKDPVLHMSLSWAQDEKPSEQHMRDTALSALKALKLDEHQALMAAHGDKDHVHVHIVVNTVHPKTGRTAPLKHSKLELSRWAEGYEREHGIKIEQRIKNNEERDREREGRKQDTPKLTPEQVLGLPERPAPEQPPPRRRKYIQIDPRVARYYAIKERHKRLRTELRHRHMVDNDVVFARQRDERNWLRQDARAAMRVATDYVADRFRSRWRDLYDAQRKELARLSAISGNLFERAVFVFWNSERLGGTKPLSFRQKVNLIRRPAQLWKAVERVHHRERRVMSQLQRAETLERIGKVEANLSRRLAQLRAPNRAEIDAQRAWQKAYRKHAVTYARARHQLMREDLGIDPPRQAARGPIGETDCGYNIRVEAEMAAHRARNVPQDYIPPPRTQTPPPRPPEPAPPSAPPPPEKIEPSLTTTFVTAAQPIPRSQQIKRDMGAWKSRNPDRDFGNEL